MQENQYHSLFEFLKDFNNLENVSTNLKILEDMITTLNGSSSTGPSKIQHLKTAIESSEAFGPRRRFVLNTLSFSNWNTFAKQALLRFGIQRGCSNRFICEGVCLQQGLLNVLEYIQCPYKVQFSFVLKDSSAKVTGLAEIESLEKTIYMKSTDEHFHRALPRIHTLSEEKLLIRSGSSKAELENNSVLHNQRRLNDCKRSLGVPVT